MSPNTYDIGKNSTPAPKVTTPSSGSSNCAIFAGPIRLEQISTMTKAAMTSS